MSDPISSAPDVATEGQYKPGWHHLPVTGGFLNTDWGDNWWQNGYLPVSSPGTRSAIVEACVGAYSQTVAMLPGDHWRSNDKGGRDRVTNSALSRILRQPNDYQSISDFLLQAVRYLYLDGNCYCYCTRNDRFEIDEIHLMNPNACRGMVAEDGSIFYTLSGNWIVDRRYGSLPHVPMRDVLHIRLQQLRTQDPLRGETPLVAAWLDAAAGDSIKQQQLNYYVNQAKPGFVLTTDQLLEQEQIDAVRDRFNAKSRGAHSGETMVLHGGLKPSGFPNISSRDAQLAEVLKMTKQDIALVFRIPLQLLGIATGGGMGRATETLLHQWVATGLGFCLNHVEEAFGRTFDLRGQPWEYVEFSTDALLRAAWKDRIEGLARGVQGGIYSPNEARNSEGYDDVPFGNEPRVQQQVVPLSAAAGIPSKSPGKITTTPIQPAPAATGQPGAPGSPGSPGARSPPNGRQNERARHLLLRGSDERIGAA